MTYILFVWITILSSGKDLFLEKEFATVRECEARLIEVWNTPLVDGTLRLVECNKKEGKVSDGLTVH